ncbi:malonate decarboxylase holo-ACP synthase [Rahnella woolbedingensis]|uniref:Malonate decarboxylase holo-ACP synthase n=1 Tax=Rahnella woolbedingensis TaxID=1510574 RepID=A0A419N5N9_9GAMM|nr:malonate decarboxylase holo-ACP synthase [Rahnella woolbedingensis]RJT42123.1 malonate decarboxylase holo-ACP synthase [Rahnella woolbedingensis]
MCDPRAHDFVWISDRSALQSDDTLPAWVNTGWRTSLPLVVRRDKRADGAIPVGIRGMIRIQRAAAWIDPAAVVRVVTPESLVSDVNTLLHSPFVSQQPVQALITLCSLQLPFPWGVTGSCAYALASDLPVMHADSDLDLLVRCDTLADPSLFSDFYDQLQRLPCRADVQINTPHGGFALSEWLRGGDVMLKTSSGPQLVRDPWRLPAD